MATAETVAIIDYGSGNLRSAEKAFARAAAEAGTGQDIVVTADPAVIASASRVVLPGVGAFADCRRGLLAIDGMGEALETAVHGRKAPFFGICVGMQLMAEWGLEHGRHPGLGWLRGAVEPLAPADPELKIPHMGWNDLALCRAHPVLEGIESGEHVYFVHSYAFRPTDPGDLLATADYGGPVTALVGRANMIGSQFHPEKSQAAGLRLIANFLRWTP
ncbi:imidazole glycerol phosphate synthase subunit HisH [Emcibacter sp. SYSU 3D8]|uniref:imidazole glycerol phosphate synthase subunit HisH n=1 Tax=Emcibacter sp. SYSU 3D8 TaxID=3133969 RepID=UPI0031FEA2F1